MKLKQHYVSPELSVIELINADVVTASGTTINKNGDVEGQWDFFW